MSVYTITFKGQGQRPEVEQVDFPTLLPARRLACRVGTEIVNAAKPRLQLVKRSLEQPPTDMPFIF